MTKQEDSYKKFVEHVYSKDHLAGLINEIETAKDAAYKDKQNTSLSKKIDKKVSIDFYRLVTEIEGSSVLPDGGKSQAEYFDKLKSYCLDLPVCKMTLAFQPSIQLLEKISDWFEREVGKKTLVDVKTSEDIVAGAQIEFAGEYRDFSISRVIDEMLENPNLEGEKK